ncbi:MAG TPA: helix-turn-helix domain-containing protein, partial [Polyangiaceae bacterium]
IPALRDRPDDILPIADFLLSRHAERNAARYELDAEARRALVDHEWPGNVRELENRIQRATLVCQAPRVTATDLGLGALPTTSTGAAPSAVPSAAPAFAAAAAPGPVSSQDPERLDLERVLLESGGVIATAAALLGISRQALYRRMDRLGIELERRPKLG